MKIALALLASLSAAASAQSGRQIIVVVDGNQIIFNNQPPMMSDGHVLVPLRGVFEKLGASVAWDPSTQSITATTRSTTVKLSIGQLDAAVNNQPVHMEIPATLVAGTTMVPLRFVSEALGASVGWNTTNQEVDITSKVDNSAALAQEEERRRAREEERAREKRKQQELLENVANQVAQEVQKQLDIQKQRDRDRERQREHDREMERERQREHDREMERQRQRDRDLGRVPPPVQPPVIIERPVVIENIVFTPDSVIPFVLQTRLNSANAQVGDQFTAVLATQGRRDYYGLPAGTVAYGSVSYARRQNDRDPGVLELAFDRLVLPNGRNLRLNGKLFDMSGPGVVRLPNGSVIAQGLPRHDHPMYTGYGKGAGVIVGVLSKKNLGDVNVNGLIGRFARPEHKSRPVFDVELRPGTNMAIRLYSELRFRKDLR